MERGSTTLVPQGLRRASEWSWRLLIVAAAVLAVGWALSKVFLVVVVVSAALLMTALFNPMAARLRARGWGTGGATAVAMITGLGLVVGIVALIAPSMVDEFGALGDKAAEGVREAQRWLDEGPLGLSSEQVDDIANGLVRQLQGEGGSSAVSGVVSGAVTAGTVLAGILLAIVLTVFFVRDGRTMFAWLTDLLPEEGRDRALRIGEMAWDTLSGYIRGIAIIGLVDALFIGLALAIMGIPLVFPLMLLTFLGAFVPIIGAFVAGMLAVLVALVDHGVTEAAILVVVIIGVQQLEGNVLYPIVMRRAVDVHPVAILIGVAVGGIIAGILGAILAVPLVAITGRILVMVREERRQIRTPDHAGEAVILDPGGGATFVSPQEELTTSTSRSRST